MPEKAPDRISVSTLGGRRMLRCVYETTNIDDADFFTSGIRSIKAVAWKPTDAGDLVSLSHSAGVVTFASTGDNHNGELWIEASGY